MCVLRTENPTTVLVDNTETSIFIPIMVSFRFPADRCLISVFVACGGHITFIRFIRDGGRVPKSEFRSCVKVEVAVLGSRP